MIQRKGFSKEALDTVSGLASTSTEQLDTLRGYLLEVLVYKASPLLFKPRADVVKLVCCHFNRCPHEIDILCLVKNHPVEMTECKVSMKTLYDPPQNYASKTVHLWENAMCLRKINPEIVLFVACLNFQRQAEYFYEVLKGQVLVVEDKEIASLFSVMGREKLVGFLFS